MCQQIPPDGCLLVDALLNLLRKKHEEGPGSFCFIGNVPGRRAVPCPVSLSALIVYEISLPSEYIPDYLIRSVLPRELTQEGGHIRVFRLFSLLDFRFCAEGKGSAMRRKKRIRAHPLPQPLLNVLLEHGISRIRTESRLRTHSNV